MKIELPNLIHKKNFYIILINYIIFMNNVNALISG